MLEEAMGEGIQTNHWLQMERLLGGLSAAATGKGRCFSLGGPAGVGKTFLLRKLEGAAEDLGFQVLRRRAELGAGPQEVFSALLPPEMEQQQSYQMPTVLSERLTDISFHGPVLVTVDDMHLADQASISMLILLARSVVHHSVMMVFSYDSEMIGTPDGDIHPLLDGVRLLARETDFEEVRLENLEREMLLRVVEEELGSPLDAAPADIIWEASEGNPAIAIETARLLVQARRLERRDGRWTASGELQAELPEEYRAMICSRLSLLAPEDREMLDIAALAGRRFDPRVIAAAMGSDLLEILERLDRAARDHRFLEEDGDSYRFSSGAVRRVVIDELPPNERTRLHGRIARALEGRMMRNAPFDDLSEHYYLAEKADKCVCFSLLAGQRALSAGDYKTAIEHFQKVLDATTGGSFHEERLFSLEGMADAAALLGRASSACHWYDEVLRGSPLPIVRDRVRSKRSDIQSGSSAPLAEAPHRTVASK